MLCCTALAFLMLTVRAESQESKNEIAGTFGRTFISNQSVLNSGIADPRLTHAPGWTFEGNYARVLREWDWADVAAEIPVVFSPDEDLVYEGNQVPEGYGSIFVTPAVRLRLIPELAFSPWVSFGGGFAHFAATSDLLFFGKNTGNRSLTTGALQMGAGIDVRLPCRKLPRLRVRAQVRDEWSGIPPINVDVGKTHQHNYYVAGGIVYKF
ncbi:MAG TPA: hypothetical protein VH596_03840 [Terriglobales bacterium]|jgi:hypothetical protein